MDDSARPHRILAVEELLESEDITNGLASVLPRFKSHRTCVGCFGETNCSTLTSSGEHTTAQTDADYGMTTPTVEMFHQLVLSMRRRCEATIAVRGGHVPY
ncbi:hypothetical protein TNCV_3552101 [Trichonephila clavipes]|nr:hypothetical protein TNCV_3552101 [Trichonephila clavipes]